MTAVPLPEIFNRETRSSGRVNVKVCQQRAAAEFAFGKTASPSATLTVGGAKAITYMADSQDGEYLSFRTNDADGWAIRLALAHALEATGYSVDLTLDPYESDWAFSASINHDRFTVVLTIKELALPCCWFIALEGPGTKPLASRKTRSEVQPILEQVVLSLPGVSHIRWHKDHTTLSDI